MVYQKSKTVLRQRGLAASKKLGQNFLVHRHTAEHIVDLADVNKEDTVLEIGVGLGALTTPLAEAASQVWKRIQELSVCTKSSRIYRTTSA